MSPAAQASHDPAPQKNANAWIARGGAFGFVGAAVSAVAGFALTVVLSRFLGTEGAGVVMQAMAVFSMLMGLSKVGMDSTAIFLLPRVAHDAPHKLAAHTIFMGVTSAGVSFLVGLGLWVLAPVIWATASPDLVAALRAVSWFLPAGALVVVAAGAMRALGGMRGYVYTQNLGLPLSRLASVAGAVGATGSAVTVSVLWALPLAVMCAISLTIVYRQLLRHTHCKSLSSEERGGLRLARVDRHRVLAFAAPRTLTAGLEQALVWLDVVVVGHIAGAAMAGIYGGASRFIQAGMIVDTALRVVVSPKLSALVHRGKHDEILRIHSTTTAWLILFASPIYVLMAVFSPTVMSILGADFVAGAPSLAILSIAVAVTFFAGNIHTLLIMSGHSGWAAVNKVIVLVINVVGNVLLIPVWGIEGAAGVWAVSMMVDAGLATAEVRHFLGVSVPLSIYVRPIMIVVVTVLIPGGLISVVFGQGVWQCLVATLVCIAAFAGACVVWRQSLSLHNLRR